MCRSVVVIYGVVRGGVCAAGAQIELSFHSLLLHARHCHWLRATHFALRQNARRMAKLCKQARAHIETRTLT